MKKTPFECLYGRPPPVLVNYSPGTSPNDEVDRELRDRDELLKELKENLERANNRMKSYYDRGRREEEFESGDWVYLKIKPYRQRTVSQQALYKLGSRFYGPYQVIKKVGAVAYKLDLPPNALIHPVVHISQLKRRLGSSDNVVQQPPEVDDNGSILLRPLRALEYRRIKRGGRYRWEVLLEWESLAVEDATWEDLAAMRQQFPDLGLEDKELVQEGRNDEGQRRILKNAYNRARRAKMKQAIEQSQEGDLHAMQEEEGYVTDVDGVEAEVVD